MQNVAFTFNYFYWINVREHGQSRETGNKTKTKKPQHNMQRSTNNVSKTKTLLHTTGGKVIVKTLIKKKLIVFLCHDLIPQSVCSLIDIVCDLYFSLKGHYLP